MILRPRLHRSAIAFATSLLALACGGDDPRVAINAPPVLVMPATAHHVIDRIEATNRLFG